jgi:hypothetical protein
MRTRLFMASSAIEDASTLPHSTHVATEDRTVRVVLERGAAVGRYLTLPDLPHDHPLGHQIVASLVVKSLISASSTVATTPSPIEAALPVILAAVWMSPPPSLRAKVTSALA